MLFLLELTTLGILALVFNLSLKIFAVSFLIYLFSRSLLLKLLGVELASGMDALFSLESSQNKSLILAAGVFDCKVNGKLYEEKTKLWIYRKGYERFRKVLIRNPLCYYWTYCKNFKIENHFRIIKDTHFKKYEEIYEFMGKELSDPEIKQGEPPWVVHFFENFGDNQSAFVLRFHHAMVDGIALMSLMLHISENDYKVIKLPTLGFFNWLVLYLLFPILGPYYLLRPMLKKRDVNIFHSGRISGKKSVYSSEPLELDKVKAVSRIFNCSINDLFVTVLMETLNVFIEKSYGKKVESLTQFIPFSMRGLPPPGHHVTFNNTMIPMMVDMPMKKDENKREILRFYKNIFLSIKNSIEPPMTYLGANLLTFLMPPSLFTYLMKSNIGKPSCGFTNVPGPLNKLNFWGNCDLGRLFFYVPTMGNIGLGFSLLTYANKLIISVQSDQSIKFNNKKFTQEFLENLEKYCDQAFEKENKTASATDFKHLKCDCCRKLK